MSPEKFHVGAGGCQQSWHQPGGPVWLLVAVLFLGLLLSAWVVGTLPELAVASAVSLSMWVHGHSSPSPPLPQKCPFCSCWVLVVLDM